MRSLPIAKHLLNYGEKDFFFTESQDSGNILGLPPQADQEVVKREKEPPFEKTFFSFCISLTRLASLSTF